jgi:hypothetical protein
VAGLTLQPLAALDAGTPVAADGGVVVGCVVVVGCGVGADVALLAVVVTTDGTAAADVVVADGVQAASAAAPTTATGRARSARLNMVVSPLVAGEFPDSASVRTGDAIAVARLPNGN